MSPPRWAGARRGTFGVWRDQSRRDGSAGGRRRCGQWPGIDIDRQRQNPSLRSSSTSRRDGSRRDHVPPSGAKRCRARLRVSAVRVVCDRENSLPNLLWRHFYKEMCCCSIILSILQLAINIAFKSVKSSYTESDFRICTVVYLQIDAPRFRSFSPFCFSGPTDMRAEKVTISISLMVARHQQPFTGCSRTLRSPPKLAIGCGSLC
jgi:hypothetical protein